MLLQVLAHAEHGGGAAQLFDVAAREAVGEQRQRVTVHVVRHLCVRTRERKSCYNYTFLQ